MSAFRRTALAVVPTLLVLLATPAAAQTPCGPNRHVAVEALLVLQNAALRR